MQRFSTAVIGGGASGITAAIAAKRLGDAVVLLEKTPRLGRKILASGNGRCNLSNDRLSPSSYNQRSRSIVSHVFKRFGREEIASFFAGLGVRLRSDKGRIFPETDQSATVLRALELEMERLSVPVEFGFDADNIVHDNGFIVSSRAGKKVACDRLIIATGGRSYPSFGSDGSGYALARRFGHTIVEPVPAAVPITAKDPLCQPLQGQKVRARVRALIGETAQAEAEGDLLFTTYGLSGTAILDISRDISVALHRLKAHDITVQIDIAPSVPADALARELARRSAERYLAQDLLVGILPNKFSQAFRHRLAGKSPAAMAAALKDLRVTVSGTRGWNEADFTAGGIELGEVGETTLESRLRPGLFFCGEVLDVDGPRGGFNLAWAWASGHYAAAAAHAVPASGRRSRHERL